MFLICLLYSRMSHSYSTARDSNLASNPRYAINSPRFDDKTTESTDTMAIQVIQCFSFRFNQLQGVFLVVDYVARLLKVKVFNYGVLSSSQGAISHLSEQIFTLNDRMDEFTSRIDAQSSQFQRTFSGNQQNVSSNDLTSQFTSNLTSGSSNGSKVHHSTSSTQLAKDSPLIEEVCDNFNPFARK
ncbi:hypothetical protein Hanom_Chr00s004270g01721211 [Helianthus anomalus]